MEKPVFRTKRGTYVLDESTGLYRVREDPTSTPKLFIGSVNPYQGFKWGPLTFTLEKVVRNRLDIFLELIKGDQEAIAEMFTDELVVGYRPFGIVCAREEVDFKKGYIKFSDSLQQRMKAREVKFELGSKIDEVYAQLPR